MEAFTPRNVAKYVAQAVVAAKTASVTKQAITDHTQFEDGDLTVDIPAHLVGWYVSWKLRPVTDGIVDKTADFIVAKREARAAKKETTTESE